MLNQGNLERLRFGPFELDPVSGELFRNDLPLSLQPQPFRVLHLLASRSGELVTREELRQALWADGTTVDFDQGLNYCIRQIRAVLGESAGEPRYIETLPKRGYRFTAQRNETQKIEKPKNSISAPPTPLFALATVAAIVLAALGFFLLKPGSTNAPQVILVRPFVGIGLTPDQAWVPDALAQQLIGELARNKKIRVLPWSTSLALKSRPSSAKQIYSEFGAQAILEGSIRRESDRWSVVAQLVDTRADRVLWSHSDHRPGIDIGGLEKSLLLSIAEPLKIQLANLASSGESRRQLDIDTYNLYLQATAMKDQLKPKGAEESAKAFEEVIRRAPSYAPAHAGLANTLITFPFLRATPPLQTLSKASEIARLAISLDPSLPEAHAALAHASFNLWSWNQAESSFKTALSLDPDSATTLQLHALYLITQRRFAEALQSAQAGLKLAPTNGLMAHTVALVHFHAGNYDESIQASQLTLNIDPLRASPHNIKSRALTMKGAFDQALVSNSAFAKVGGGGAIANLWLAYIQARSGKREEAKKILASWQESTKGKGVPPLPFALALLECGDTDRGFDALQKSIEAHLTSAVWMKATPELDKWRNDPRMLSILDYFDKASSNNTAVLTSPRD